MEKVDLKLVESFYSVIHKKRIQNQYFYTLGQLKFSKCASKGLDVSFVNEYLIDTMININHYASLMAYTQTLKKKKIEQNAKTKENLDHILFNINRFNMVKAIDKGIFQE